MVLNEITPLSDKDCFYIIDRHKTQFTYPVHRHKELEINFIENAAGACRIVGDSVETIGDYDLVLIGGENLEHTWQQGKCKSSDIREITIQFTSDLFSEVQLGKNQFVAIRRMLSASEHGVAFPMNAIMLTYRKLEGLVHETDHFIQYLRFLDLLNDLASGNNYRVLASSAFANIKDDADSRRINKVKRYIDTHVDANLRLKEIAEYVGMSPTSFSTFFKLHTGRTLSDYIIDIKLGRATRLLVDTNRNIAEICYECGFNNLSNFNRIFKAKRGYTPREFRALYKKNKILV